MSFIRLIGQGEAYFHLVSSTKVSIIRIMSKMSPVLLSGGSAGPSQPHDGAFLSHGHTPAAVRTCREAAGGHGAEEPPHQARRAGQPSHRRCVTEEQHRRATQPHRRRRLLQRGEEPLPSRVWVIRVEFDRKTVQDLHGSVKSVFLSPTGLPDLLSV